jgi:hypothetical protein
MELVQLPKALQMKFQSEMKASVKVRRHRVPLCLTVEPDSQRSDDFMLGLAR